MFQGGRRNHQIGAVIAKGGTQLPPAAGRVEVKGQDAIPVKSNERVQPAAERLCKRGIFRLLPGNTPFVLANANDA
jgi:hypothetical protein